MKIDLDKEASQQLVVATVLDSLTSEQKETIVAEAAKALLKPIPKKGYNEAQPSPLQKSLNGAVQQHADGMIRELLEKDEALRAKLESVIREGIDEALVQQRAMMVHGITLAVREAFRVDK